MKSLIDIVIPIHFRQIGHALWTISSIREMTASPHRLILSVSGGIKSDLDPLREVAEEVDTILHERKVIGNGRSINEALEFASSPYLAVIEPTVEIQDKMWIGKFQNVMVKSPSTGLIAVTNERQLKTNRAPVRVVNRLSHPNGPIAFLTKRSIENHLPAEPDDDWIGAISRNCLRRGAARWIHPGVKYDFHV